MLDGSTVTCFLQVRCYDWDSDGSHDLIGEFHTTLGELSRASEEKKKVVSSSQPYFYHFILYFTVGVASD